MAEREKDIRKFRRAARQRMRAADLLKEHGYNLEAVYLGGYGVECALKALILARTSRNRHADILERLTSVGAKGHDYRYLLRFLQRNPINCEIPADIRTRFQLVNSWTTTLRYEVFQLEAREAKKFLHAGRIIVEWTERS